MEKRIDEIVKIICHYRTDDGKCNCNAHQFGVRECSDPCAYRQIAEQLVDAEYAPVVHGEWCVVEPEYLNCSVCGTEMYTACNSAREAELLKRHWKPYCPNCGADMRDSKK